ncbi:MAG: hypothetical protein NUW37_14745 [Planctomycetes bacterium]|nr:hypothetical protein [Planctomycetota bacterium]
MKFSILGIAFFLAVNVDALQAQDASEDNEDEPSTAAAAEDSTVATDTDDEGEGLEARIEALERKIETMSRDREEQDIEPYQEFFGEFELAFSGYIYSEAWFVRDNAGGVGNVTTTTPSQFDNHYFNLGLSGSWNQNIRMHATFEIEHSNAESYVEEAYIDFDYTDAAFIVRVGRIITPFNIFDDYHDPIGNHFVTRPHPIRRIVGSAWKTTGLEALGTLPLSDDFAFNYALYVENGRKEASNLRSTRQEQDNNSNKAIGARLGFDALDMLKFGGSFWQGEYDDDDRGSTTLADGVTPTPVGNLWMRMYGFYARLDVEGLSLYGEYVVATAENFTAPSLDAEESGAFTWLTYTLEDVLGDLGDFRFGVRWDIYTYNSQTYDPQTQIQSGQLLGKTQYQYAINASWLPHEQVDVKFEYLILKEGKRLTEVANNAIAIQVGARF